MHALLNANLVDVAAGAILADMTVLIQNGSITAVGPNLPIPAEAVTVPLQGRYVLPGLIDLHTHISGSAGFDHPEPGQRKNTYDYSEAREGFFDWGVLTVRTCGDICPDVLQFRDEMKAALPPRAPTVFAAGPWVQGENAHPLYTVYGANPVYQRQGCFCVDDESDLTAVVLQIRQQGVDWLKLFYGGNPMLFSDKPMTRMSRYCLHELTRLGHENGLKVMVHVDGATDMAEAADAGVDTIEHTLAAGYGDDSFTPELYQLLVQKRIAVIPTMDVSKRLGGGVDFALETHERLKTVIREMHEAGVVIGAGCDSGVPFVPFGESLHEELACLVSAGFSPAEAIRAATAVNASLLGCQETAGKIEAGFDADLLIVKENPLKDIEHTKQIQMVIKSGAIVRDHITGCRL